MDPKELSTRLDAALYRIRSRKVTNITPFTYRDGITYLQVLERIRTSMVECIEYCNAFGDDVDEIIRLVNETVVKFITDAANLIEDIRSYNDEKKAQVDASIAAMETLIEDFKARLIASQWINNGDGTLNVPLMDGNRLDIYNKAGADAEHNLIRTSLNESVAALTALVNTTDQNIRTKIDNDISDITALVNNRYTKSESDARFAPMPLKRCVIIGSSNVTDNLGWTRALCNHYGWEHHNWAIGGGGFTSSETSSFIQQVRNAINNIDEATRRTVGHFLVVDSINDMRAQNNVEAAAEACFALIRNNFPNARIIDVPVVLNSSSMNKPIQVITSVIARENEIRRAGLRYNVEVVEGTPSWFIYTSDYSQAVNETGGGIHLSPYGFDVLRMWIQRYIDGAPTWNDCGWLNLHPNSTSNINPNYNYMRVSRHRNFVTLSGSFRTGSALGFDTPLMTLPLYATPYDGVNFIATGDDRVSKWLYVNTSGQVASRDTLNENQTYRVEFTYRVF